MLNAYITYTTKRRTPVAVTWMSGCTYIVSIVLKMATLPFVPQNGGLTSYQYRVLGVSDLPLQLRKVFVLWPEYTRLDGSAVRQVRRIRRTRRTRHLWHGQTFRAVWRGVDREECPLRPLQVMWKENLVSRGPSHDSVFAALSPCSSTYYPKFQTL